MPETNNDKLNLEFRELSEIIKVYDKVIGKEKEYQKVLDLTSKKYLKQKQEEIKSLRNQIEETKKLEMSDEDRAKKIEQLEQQITSIKKSTISDTIKLEEQASKISQRLWATSYKNATLSKKLELKNQQNEAIKSAREQAEKELEILTQQRDLSDKGSDERKQLNKELNQRRSFLRSISKEQKQSEQELNKLKLDNIKDLAKSGLKSDRDAAKQQLKELTEQNKKTYNEKLKNEKNLRKELQKLQESGASQKKIDEAQKKLSAAQEETALARSNNKSTAVASVLEDVAQSLMNAANAMANAVVDAQRNADRMMSTYQSRVNANLQGTGNTFQDMLEMVEKNLAISPVVKMEDVINSIKEASDQGIMYNIEQRAFLDTVSEKIAHTFDAFDSNLARLIRLQQADSTAARLGLEASLTKLFNSTFNDSSYLSDVYDAVSQAIIDANSQLTKEQSAEFEYTLQKWLGSLYSMGLSSNTVTQIAEGINMLATGDVTNLANNSSMQTLLAMSASNAGLDFAQIMLDGLDVSTTNQLLESMVEYLKTIAENSDSQVVKSAYGEIFNMSLSDLKAFSNMTTQDISRISGTSLSYNNMVAETQSQLLQTVLRSSMTENMSNIFSNALYGMGLDLAQNPATWTLDKVLQFMESSGIDINIPFINVFGSGLDLNTSVTQLMRMGLGVAGAFSLIGNVLGALGTDGRGTGLALSDWGGTEINQRGSGVGDLLSTMIGGTSSSTYVSNSNTSDIQTTAISSATDDAAETSKITNKNAKTNEYTLDDFYSAMIGNSATDFVKVKDEFLQNVYDISTDSLRTLDYGINQVRKGDYLRVKDDSFGNYFGKFTFDSGSSLRVVETSGNLTRIISKIEQLSSTMKSDKPMAVSIPSSTTIRIDQNTLVQAILTALGGSGDNIKLKQFIDGSLQEGMDNKVPIMAIRNETGQDINVNLNNVSPMVSLDTY